MSNKILTIKIQNKNLGKGIQKLALRHGFRWNDGICKVRDTGENEFFMEIDFVEGTMKYLSFFQEPADYIQFADSYEIENEFDNPEEVLALKRAFQRYAKDWIEEIKPEIVNPPIKPKYVTWEKRRGQKIQHIHNLLACMDEI